MTEISTSILTVEENEITTFYNLEVAKTDYFHIDVMDGKFVKNNNKEFMKESATSIKHISNLPLDVHLMVEDVDSFIDEYIDLKPSIITFHVEAVENQEKILELIKKIKENGIRAGIAVNPYTPIQEVYPFLEFIHMVLVMSVETGKGGQKFMVEIPEKIEALTKYIEENNIDIDIEVDGGINPKTAVLAKDAGANILVAGTAILSSDNYSETITKIREA